MGGPSERTAKNHQEVINLYNQKYENAREVYKREGWNFQSFKPASLYQEVADELCYQAITVRIIINGYGKTVRQQHKAAICRLSLKKTPVGI
jgi:hypothetical protein